MCVTTSAVLLIIQFCFVFCTEVFFLFLLQSDLEYYDSYITLLRFTVTLTMDSWLCVYIYIYVFFSPVNEILSVTFDPNFLQMEDNPGT